PARDDLRLQAEPHGELGRLRPASVDEHDLHAHLMQEADLLDESLERLALLQDASAGLHDEHLFLIKADVRDRLLQRGDDVRHDSSTVLGASKDKRTALAVCSRFSAWSITTDEGPSSTASSTLRPRRTGRQCMKTPPSVVFILA